MKYNKLIIQILLNKLKYFFKLSNYTEIDNITMLESLIIDEEKINTDVSQIEKPQKLLINLITIQKKKDIWKDSPYKNL